MSSTAFEERIGYTFKDPALLRKALTHSSATNENTNGVAENNERLEFLGDAVFDVIISEYLYHRMTDVEEGQLSKLRALVVCERSLSECGKRLRINEELRLGRGEELNGGRNRSSILADAMEAVIGLSTWTADLKRPLLLCFLHLILPSIWPCRNAVS